MENDKTENLKKLQALPSSKLITRTERNLRDFYKLGKMQIGILEQYKKDKIASGVPPHVGFLYFDVTLRGLWDNVYFVLALGNGKNKKHSSYPARALLEGALRLEHYVRQNFDGQDRIAIFETARITKFLFEIDKDSNNQEGMLANKKQYDEVISELTETLPSIENINYSKLDPFPSIADLSKSTATDLKNSYTTYRYLCEITHTKMVLTKSQIDGSGEGEYRRALLVVSLVARELLKLTAYYMDGNTQEDVTKVLEAARTRLFA